MAVAREGVVDFHLRVAGGDEAHGEGDGFADVGFAVVHEVAELAEDHFLADFFAHGDEGEAEDGVGLDEFFAFFVFAFFFVVLVAEV